MRTIGYYDVHIPSAIPQKSTGKEPKNPPTSKWKNSIEVDEILEELKKIPKPDCEKNEHSK